MTRCAYDVRIVWLNLKELYTKERFQLKYRDERREKRDRWDTDEEGQEKKKKKKRWCKLYKLRIFVSHNGNQKT